jgi:hypothetical protein
VLEDWEQATEGVEVERVVAAEPSRHRHPLEEGPLRISFALDVGLVDRPVEVGRSCTP